MVLFVYNRFLQWFDLKIVRMDLNLASWVNYITQQSNLAP